MNQCHYCKAQDIVNNELVTPLRRFWIEFNEVLWICEDCDHEYSHKHDTVSDCWDCGKPMTDLDADHDCPHCGSFTDKDVELEHRAAIERGEAPPKHKHDLLGCDICNQFYDELYDEEPF